MAENLAQLFKALCTVEKLPVVPGSLDRLTAGLKTSMLISITSFVAELEASLPALPTGSSTISSRLREAKYEDLNADHLRALLNAILNHSDANPNDQVILDAAHRVVGNGKEEKPTISEPHDGTAVIVASAFWQKDRTSVPDSASAFLLQKLQGYHDAYILHPPSYVAPYAAIVGPSGIGKSFTIKELAVTHEQYVVYVNLSNPESSDYPRRSALADVIQRFPTIKFDVCATAWTNLIKCLCLDAKANYEANVSPREFFHIQATNRNYTRNLTTDLPILAAQQNEESFQAFFKCRKERLAKSISEGEIQPETPSHLRKTSMAKPDAALKIVLCLDEAGTLLNNAAGDSIMFRAFERGARNIPDYDFFAVLLDTTSRIVNFPPTRSFDPSQMSVDHPHETFDPIYSINTFDVFAEAQSHFTIDGSQETCKRLFKLGRPLWGALLNSGYTLGEIRSLASNILGPDSEANYHLVLIAHRISFYITDFSLADYMVARCLRYIIHINSERTVLATAMGSEPLLATEAKRRMEEPSAKLACLRELTAAYGKGLINLGDAGEIVAALILLFSIDTTQHVLPEAIKLSRFLEVLLGSKVADDIKRRLDRNARLKTLWENGDVYFNHFYRPLEGHSHDYPSTFISKAYQRSAALFFPRNFPGADIGIPIQMPNGEYSMILVQVKNWTSGSKNSSLEKSTARIAVEEARAHIEGLDDCFGLVMSLHPDRERKAGVVFCDQSERTMYIQEAKKTSKELFTVLAVGLNSQIYPSVCPTRSPESTHIFHCLRTLRDADPSYRLGKFDLQTSRMVRNILDWCSDESISTTGAQDVAAAASSDRDKEVAED